MDNTELFRNELLAKLADSMTPDQVIKVLKVFDMTCAGYDIERKAIDLIPLDGIPEVVKAFIASKSIENASMMTLKQYKYKLYNFFDAVRKPFQDVTAMDIRRYLNDYREKNGVSNSTLKHTRAVLNTFYDWCVANEYILRNPVAKIERIKANPPPREPLTYYELELIRWCCQDIREKALVDFLFSTGCRVSECAAVKLTDIDWNTRTIVIPHGKGDKARKVFFNAEAEVSMREYLKTRDDDTNALFVSVRKPHKPISSHALENIMQKIKERSSVDVYPHKLRHTFATSGIRSGMPLPTLQTLLGHVNPSTTMIYAKLDTTDLQKEHLRVFS